MSSEGDRAVNSGSRELVQAALGVPALCCCFRQGCLNPLFSWLMSLCQTCLFSQAW